MDKTSLGSDVLDRIARRYFYEKVHSVNLEHRQENNKRKGETLVSSIN